jgi:hypothetical protein
MRKLALLIGLAALTGCGDPIAAYHQTVLKENAAFDGMTVPQYEATMTPSPPPQQTPAEDAYERAIWACVNSLSMYGQSYSGELVTYCATGQVHPLP